MRNKITKNTLITSIIGSVFVGVIIFSTIWWEYKQETKDIYSILRNEANNLINTILAAGENTLAAQNLYHDQLEKQFEIVINELKKRKIDELSLVKNQSFFDSEYQIEVIAVRSQGGDWAINSENIDESFLENIYQDLFFETKGENKVFFSHYSPDVLFGAIFKMSEQFDILIVSNNTIHNEIMDNTGIGKLLNDIGETPGVEYILFQDVQGVIAASKNLKEISSLVGDEFLENVIRNGIEDSRMTQFEESSIFEIVHPISFEELETAILRVGLSTDQISAIQDRMMQRVIGTIFVVFLAGIGLMSLLNLNKKYSMLGSEYSDMKSYTRDVLIHMSDAVMVLNNKDKITIFNKAAELIFEIDSKKVVGKSPIELGEIFSGKCSDMLRSAEYTIDERCDLDINGYTKNLNVCVSKISDKMGEFSFAVIVLNDITEKLKIETELQRKDKLAAMGSLAAGVAHEIRNPLNAIGMIAQRLKLEFTPDDSPEEYDTLLTIVKQEISRLNNIIEEFLEYGHTDNLSLQKSDIRVLMKESIELFKGQLQNSDILIEEKMNGAVNANVDSEKMKQVFLNLLLNASQSIDFGGKVSVDCRSEGERVIVSVKDNGEGISSDNMNRIFDIYFTTKKSGSGMGLPIVQKIVEAHNGKIEVNSAVGEGSEFKIILNKTI